MQLDVYRKSQQMKLIQQLTVSTHVYSYKIIRYNNISLITHRIPIPKFKNINNNSRIHPLHVNYFIYYYIILYVYRYYLEIVCSFLLCICTTLRLRDFIFKFNCA